MQDYKNIIPTRTALTDLLSEIGYDITTERGKMGMTTALVTLGYVASLLQIKVKIPDTLVIQEVPMNAAAAVFGTSGCGKSSTMTRMLDCLYKPVFEYLRDTGILEQKADAQSNYIRSLFPDSEDLYAWDKLVGAHKYTGIMEKASSYSLDELQAMLQINGIGGVNVFVDEIGSKFQEKMLYLGELLASFENGIRQAQRLKENTKSENNTNFPIGLDIPVPVNILIAGEHRKFINSGEHADGLKVAFAQGWIRRLLVCYLPSQVERNETLEDYLKVNTEAGNETYNTYVKSIANRLITLFDTLYKKDIKYFGVEGYRGLVYRLTNDALTVVFQMKQESEALSRELAPSREIESADLFNSVPKLVKIAGLIAMLDGSDCVIEVDHVLEAYKVLGHHRESLSALVNTPKPYVVFSELLIRKTGSMFTRLDLIEEDGSLELIFNSPTKTKSMLEYATDYLKGLNYTLNVSTIDSIIYFSVDHTNRLETEHMIVTAISASDISNVSNIAIPFLDRLKIGAVAETTLYNRLYNSKHVEYTLKSAIKGFNTLIFEIPTNFNMSTLDVYAHAIVAKNDIKYLILPISKRFSWYMQTIYDYLLEWCPILQGLTYKHLMVDDTVVISFNEVLKIGKSIIPFYIPIYFNGVEPSELMSKLNQIQYTSYPLSQKDVYIMVLYCIHNHITYIRELLWDKVVEICGDTKTLNTIGNILIKELKIAPINFPTIR